MRQLFCALALLPLVSIASPPATTPANADLHVVQTLSLGGTGGFGTIRPSTARITGSTSAAATG